MTKDFGLNAGLVSELVGMYLHDRQSVDEQWRAYFDALIGGGDRPVVHVAPQAAAGAHSVSMESIPPSQRLSLVEAQKQTGVAQLVGAYRARGHLLAHIDPLGLLMLEAPPALVDFKLETFGLSEHDLDAEFQTVDMPGPRLAPLRDIVARLQATYCGSIGVEFRDIEDPDQRNWLQERMESTLNRVELEPALARRILEKLTDAETLETFIHKSFPPGTKRFSLQGGESLIPMLDLLLDAAGDLGAEEVVIGMAHRGRLNVLVNILDKAVSEIFAAFQDQDPERHLGSGDVKYHLGASTDRLSASGRRMHLTLAFNPSHLEWVNPVVEGRVRSKQDRKEDWDRRKVVPLLVHGDAAFIGQGVNSETLNLARLEGYATGGTVHVIVNNQVGFTTIPRDARSTRYATDLARLLRVPVFHVNGEDLGAVAHVAKLTAEYRQKFGGDVVVDLYCYRRYGHNEGDEPRFTQPTMYAAIDEKPTIREIFAKSLEDSKKVPRSEIDAIAAKSVTKLETALEATKRSEISWVPHAMGGVWIPYRGGKDTACPEVETKVEEQKLLDLVRQLAHFPDGFHANPKVAEVYKKRVEKLESGEGFDWGTGEALAFASILAEKTPIRLSGQDARRGTFSHRHSVLFDAQSGERHTPLEHLSSEQGRFEVYDSPLSEAGVLGFDYGYSLDHPDALVIWEAQFGDFANGAQVIIDQFITSAEDKWRRLSGITLLLPHGYEGQGPEHSNARFGRFLSLAAEDNIQVCNLTTPAQLFHCLRRQVRRAWRKPLVIMSPKSLLRVPAKPSPLLHACSTLRDLSEGKFQRVIADVGERDPKSVKKILMCSGKVYYDLAAAREARKANDVAIIRVEQMYPLNQELADSLAGYKDGTPIVWVQEEPWNMGSWYFVKARFPSLLDDRFPFTCVARDESASPATGSHASHKLEQTRLLDQAFG